MRAAAVVLVGLLFPALSAAQSEQALREFFEGRTVVINLDMPGTSAGVDVYPEDGAAVDQAVQAERLSSHGAAICRGQAVRITKLKVKKRHIEFQLAGGGRGSRGRSLHHRSYRAPNLTGSWPGQRVQQITALLENPVHLDADYRTQLAEERQALMVESGARRDWREPRGMSGAGLPDSRAGQCALLHGRGSRFNIRYYGIGLPEEALSPESVMSALDRYIEFGSATPSEADGPAPEVLRAAAGP